jgi:hypothetical protein
MGERASELERRHRRDRGGRLEATFEQCTSLVRVRDSERERRVRCEPAHDTPVPSGELSQRCVPGSEKIARRRDSSTFEPPGDTTDTDRIRVGQQPCKGVGYEADGLNRGGCIDNGDVEGRSALVAVAGHAPAAAPRAERYRRLLACSEWWERDDKRRLILGVCFHRKALVPLARTAVPLQLGVYPNFSSGR